MANAQVVFQSDEIVYGKFERSGEYISYEGKLTVYNRKTKKVQLKLKCSYNNFILEEIMQNAITFSGDSISILYGKLSRWYKKYDITFQN